MSSNIRITNIKGGVDCDACNESVRLIKKAYAAMKFYKVFYKFQRNFMPLRGMTKKSYDYAVNLYEPRFSSFAYGVHIGDITYNPMNNREILKKAKKEDLYKELASNLYGMLSSSNIYWKTDKIFMGVEQFNELYAKYYLKDYVEKNGLKPVSIAVKNLFGTICAVLFEIVLFLLIYSVSPMLASILFTIFFIMISLSLISFIITPG